MLKDVIYSRYNDENKILIEEFYSLLLDREKSKIIDALDGYTKLIGNGINEELRCWFACEFPEYDEDYFGDMGIAYYFDYPAVDEDCAIILTYEECFQYILKVVKKYIEMYPLEKKIVEKYLDKIKIAFNI